MTAAVQFFCAGGDEASVARFLLGTGDIVVLAPSDGRLQALDRLEPRDVTAFAPGVQLVLWNPACGELVWHPARPSLNTATSHGTLVNDLFAGLTWDEGGLGALDRLLDLERSPVLLFRRGAREHDAVLPCELVAPPSSLAALGPAYDRWAKRCLAWLRRRGVKVHDWREPAPEIPNRLRLLSTVYALPEAAAEIREAPGTFAIS